jgi:L-threonylcarbamoyladenylate synthase
MFSKEKEEEILRAANLLKQEELVAIPTETVYGLAANAFSDKAVMKIFEVKNRPQINPLIIHIKGVEVLESVAKNIPIAAYRLANHYWPGPLTLVLDKRDCISSIITANKSTVGVRVPNHKVTLDLLNKLDFPLVAPSANRSNHISPTKPEHVKSSLGKASPYILDGGTCKEGLESTILGFNGSDVFLYRHGVITKEAIEAFLGRAITEKGNVISPESPGMFLKHYAPKTNLLLSIDLVEDTQKYKNKKIGFLCFENFVEGYSKDLQRVLSDHGNLVQAASNLYSMLHELDALELDLIIAETAPDNGIGVAINDKLKRASKK